MKISQLYFLGLMIIASMIGVHGTTISVDLPSGDTLSFIAHYSAFGTPTTVSTAGFEYVLIPIDQLCGPEIPYSQDLQENLVGKIAIISIRTTQSVPESPTFCRPIQRVLKAVDAGASGVVCYNEAERSPTDFIEHKWTISWDAYRLDIPVPSVSVSNDTANQLMAFPNGTTIAIGAITTEEIDTIQAFKNAWVFLRVWVPITTGAALLWTSVFLFLLIYRDGFSRNGINGRKIMLGEIIVFCVFRFLYYAIDPKMDIGLLSILGGRFLFEFSSSFMVLIFCLLLFLWGLALKRSRNRSWVIPKRFIISFLVFNIVVLILQIYAYATKSSQTATYYNLALAVVVLVLAFSFTVTGIFLLVRLNAFTRTITSEGKRYIQKFTIFTTSVVILGVMLISFLISNALAPTMPWWNYEIAWRVIETALLYLVIFLFTNVADMKKLLLGLSRASFGSYKRGEESTGRTEAETGVEMERSGSPSPSDSEMTSIELKKNEVVGLP
eukprot:TRINITY_DN19289_c0_g1_i1.p1 TRINITY_DN19289_c0_g1~~TRINITY_DN19289_c0_g1_i1.p1  ORF type:complete len:497 (-),score=78.49 TRINITY_DN19289_c0_g1_i1:36-1526(-)